MSSNSGELMKCTDGPLARIPTTKIENVPENNASHKTHEIAGNH